MAVASHLVYGRTRTEIAAALIEYRAFLRDNPDSEVRSIIEDAANGLRGGLREHRRIARATR